MNHSHHSHHGHDHGHHAEGMDDGASMDVSATKQLINATVELITSTLSPPAMDHAAHGAHAHHNHGIDDASLSSAASNVADHSGHGSHGQGHWMKMWFHTGYEEVILFDFWRIETLTGLLFSCVGIFILGALYEGLKWFRVHLQTVFESRQLAQKKSRAPNGAPLLGSSVENGRSPRRTSTDVYAPTTSESDVDVQLNSRQSLFSALHLIQTVLYVLQLTLAYWLMLIVMTYNIYLTIAVVLGAGFGHWLFASFSCLSPQAESFVSDACH